MNKLEIIFKIKNTKILNDKILSLLFKYGCGKIIIIPIKLTSSQTKIMYSNNIKYFEYYDDFLYSKNLDYLNKFYYYLLKENKKYELTLNKI